MLFAAGIIGQNADGPYGWLFVFRTRVCAIELGPSYGSRLGVTRVLTVTFVNGRSRAPKGCAPFIG